MGTPRPLLQASSRHGVYAVHVAQAYRKRGAPRSCTLWRGKRIKAMIKDQAMHRKRLRHLQLKTLSLSLVCSLCSRHRVRGDRALASQSAGGFIESVVIAGPNNLVSEPVHVL